MSQIHLKVATYNLESVFVHYSAVQRGFKSLSEGDIVEFDVRVGVRGLHATNVIIIGHDGAL